MFVTVTLDSIVRIKIMGFRKLSKLNCKQNYKIPKV